MKCEILSIGSELTSGQNLDTNSQWLSQRLAEIGIAVGWHTTISDDLDANVEAWTSQRDRYEVMDVLQRVGVPAGAVQDAADRLERDPQLAARGHYTMLGNAEVDPLPLEGVPFRMSATPPHTGGVLHRGPPCLGEDNEAVLGEVLGMGAEDVEALRAEGALS